MSDDDLRTGGGADALSSLQSSSLLDDRLVGTKLGDYYIVRLIARGGMGRVYLAERRDGSFERQVALKIAPGSSLSKQLEARFRTEQRLLASLNHPSIAQLYDARISEEGWPYFVMEYVDGGSITDYCARKDLPMRERIRLLIEVVDAVAFAHARLIVHRDIKPGNVLVNAEGRPKLLDFGIAKLLAGEASTLTRAVPMTPRYASPEQLLDQPITTAVDTYQLGLLIYEVLTGKSLNSDTTLPTAIERARQQKTPKLEAGSRRSLPREVVRIIEHCLRSDANDRYRDAGALRNDLEAYVEGYPVKAVGQGTAYRLSTALRRNWLPVAMSAVVVIAIIAALLQSTIQRNRLEDTRATLEDVTAFQQDMLLDLDAEAMGEQLRQALADRNPADVNFTDVSRQAIDRNILSGAVAAIEDSFSDRPLLASRLRDVVGQIYETLGMYDRSLPLRERIVADREELLGASHSDTLHAVESLGALLFDIGDYGRAAGLFERAYRARRAAHGPDHPDTVAALGDFGNMLIDLNRNDEAERYLTEALERSRRVFGERHWSTASVLSNLGYLYYVQGRNAEALPIFEEAYEIERQNRGAEAPETLVAANNLAGIYEEIGRPAEGEKLYRELLAIETRVRGETHPSTLTTMNNLAMNLRIQRRYEEASEILEQVAEGLEATVGEDHPDALKASGNYAGTLNDLERPGDAEAILVDLLALARSSLPPNHEIIGVLLARYGRSLRLQGRFQDAEAALLDSRRIMLDEVGATGARKNANLEYLADLYEDWGRPEQQQAILNDMDPVDD